MECTCPIMTQEENETDFVQTFEEEEDIIQEELNWDAYKSILVKYDPRPNYSKIVQHDRNLLIKFDFEVPGISGWLDDYTRILLFKLLKNRTIKQISGLLTEGKEAVLLRAYTFDGEECVIKIFKMAYSVLENNNFTVADKKKALTFCAHQEKVNLEKLAKLGFPCPRVINQRKHVVVMSFIGDGGIGAKTLGESQLDPQQCRKAYREIVDCITKSYQINQVCHGNLNVNNILWHQNKCHFIGLSQSVTTTHPNAQNFLMLSITRIYKFFKSKDLPGLTRCEKQFRNITGTDFKANVKFATLPVEFFKTLKEEYLHLSYMPRTYKNPKLNFGMVKC